MEVLTATLPHIEYMQIWQLSSGSDHQMEADEVNHSSDQNNGVCLAPCYN
jgi:hypothetical protein